MASEDEMFAIPNDLLKARERVQVRLWISFGILQGILLWTWRHNLKEYERETRWWVGFVVSTLAIINVCTCTVHMVDVCNYWHFHLELCLSDRAWKMGILLESPDSRTRTNPRNFCPGELQEKERVRPKWRVVEVLEESWIGMFLVSRFQHASFTNIPKEKKTIDFSSFADKIHEVGKSPMWFPYH